MQFKRNSPTKNAIAAIMTAVATVFLVLATLVACIFGFAFNYGFYEDEYKKLGAAAYVGVPEAELYTATDLLLSYITGGADSLDYEITNEDGEAEEYYDERDKAHMVDVRELYFNARTLMGFWFVAGAALIVIAYLIKREAALLLKTAFISVIACLVAFAALGIWIAVDFNSFWVAFHGLMFSNDLWMLDPAISRLIRMYPGEFFFDLVAAILAVFIALMAAALIVTHIFSRRARKKRATYG